MRYDELYGGKEVYYVERKEVRSGFVCIFGREFATISPDKKYRTWVLIRIVELMTEEEASAWRLAYM